MNIYKSYLYYNDTNDIDIIKYLDYKQNPYYFNYDDKSKIKESNIKPIIKKINFNKSTQTENVEDKTEYIPTIINDKLINPSVNECIIENNNALIIKITDINDIEKKKKEISDYFYENNIDDDSTDIVI